MKMSVCVTDLVALSKARNEYESEYVYKFKKNHMIRITNKIGIKVPILNAQYHHLSTDERRRQRRRRWKKTGRKCSILNRIVI